MVRVGALLITNMSLRERRRCTIKRENEKDRENEGIAVLVMRNSVRVEKVKETKMRTIRKDRMDVAVYK